MENVFYSYLTTFKVLHWLPNLSIRRFKITLSPACLSTT